MEKNLENKQEKKKVSLLRTLQNNIFALKIIWIASPFYFIVYLSSSIINGSLDFLSEGYLLRRIVNGIQRGDDMKEIFIFVAILAIVSLIIKTLFDYFWNVVSPVKQRRVTAYVEKMLFKKSSSVELACYENPEFYDKYVRAMDEANRRITAVISTLDSLLSKLIALSANSLLLFIIDPWLILFGLFPLLLGYFKRLDNIAGHEMELEKKPIFRRIGYVKRTFYMGEYAKEMRIGGMYANMLNDLKDTYKEFKRIQKKYGTKKAIYGYIQKIGLDVITILGAIIYSVYSVLIIGPENGGMLVGDCIVVIGSIGAISYSLNNLVQNLAEFGEHALFLEDVRFFLDYEIKINDGGTDLVPNEVLNKAKDNEPIMKVNNVSFKYEGSESNTIKNVSFTWNKGERIALVGCNGSGKTTLVKLLLRLYDVSDGEIILNGKNIKEYNIRSYRDCFSTVFQDFRMFSLTVKENVLLRPSDDSENDKVIEALKESGAYEKISTFENGLDTILTREFDDKGENLSGGEMQKLSLARVFADDTPFVLLDEPSSALDPIAEYNMFENMMRATEGRNVIFISHRLSSAVLADKVILMDKGEIKEIGTHSSLMALNGLYADMFHRQAENYLGKEGEM